MNNYSFIIPTKNRSEIVNRLLFNLLQQEYLPVNTIVVDASEDEETREKCINKDFANLNVKYIKSERSGLTYQRNIGLLNCNTEYSFMLDDDVLLESTCSRELVRYLDQNDDVAAVAALITNEYGKKWYFKFRLFHKLGLVEILRPGSYTKYGEFLQLSFHEQKFHGFRQADFLPAGASMFRNSSIKEIIPDSNFRFGGEDKHWTLRLGQKYKIGVLGEARLFHEHFPGGVRKDVRTQSRILEENKYIIFNEYGNTKKITEKYGYKIYHWISFFYDLGALIFIDLRNFKLKYGFFYGRFVGLFNLTFRGYSGIKERIRDGEK